MKGAFFPTKKSAKIHCNKHIFPVVVRKLKKAAKLVVLCKEPGCLTKAHCNGRCHRHDQLWRYWNVPGTRERSLAYGKLKRSQKRIFGICNFCPNEALVVEISQDGTVKQRFTMTICWEHRVDQKQKREAMK